MVQVFHRIRRGRCFKACDFDTGDCCSCPVFLKNVDFFSPITGCFKEAALVCLYLNAPNNECDRQEAVKMIFNSLRSQSQMMLSWQNGRTTSDTDVSFWKARTNIFHIFSWRTCCNWWIWFLSFLLTMFCYVDRLRWINFPGHVYCH